MKNDFIIIDNTREVIRFNEETKKYYVDLNTPLEREPNGRYISVYIEDSVEALKTKLEELCKKRGIQFSK